MLFQLLLFLAGLTALVAGANALVRGASKLALAIGISPLVVGLTVVAFGTSSPELAVSVGAALAGKADIAVGNVVGSNIFNVLFILGISAAITPLVVKAQLIRQEVPVMIGASLLLLALALDRHLGRLDCALLALLLLAYLTFLVAQSRRQHQRADVSPAGWDRHWSVQLLLIAGGLLLLVLGARWLVGAAVTFAQALGISDVVVALTIVAAGTSMPEVATSIVAALKGERDIAVGNVVGSNTFNILGCLGISGAVAAGGLPVAPSVLHFDIWVMIAVALACLPVFFSGREIARWEGCVLLGYYLAYTAYLILAAQRHDALPLFSWAMLLFVLPLTAIALVASVWRSQHPRGG